LPRKEAYRKAIINSCSQKVVLDVGTGSGAIAVQLLRTDVKFVHAVEASGMIDVARSVVELLEERNRIRLYHSTIE
jgi:precorrin-6B methylase 2